jgi:quercetin dioxygenase-like cupin family protein
VGAIKSFPIFSETVDVHVTSAMSNGASSVLISHTPPGGGPPPHTHEREDEIFTALEGQFELLVDGAWQPIAIGVPVLGARGKAHTFRNAGKTNGRLHIVAVPGGMDEFLEELSPLTQTMDLAKILALGKRYGIALHVPGGPPAA